MIDVQDDFSKKISVLIITLIFSAPQLAISIILGSLSLHLPIIRLISVTLPTRRRILQLVSITSAAVLVPARAIFGSRRGRGVRPVLHLHSG